MDYTKNSKLTACTILVGAALNSMTPTSSSDFGILFQYKGDGASAQCYAKEIQAYSSIKSLREEFLRLADQWRKETGRSSVVSLRYSNESYLKILMMRWDAVPYILEELRDRPDRWFSALRLITGENPTGPQDSFDSAVQAWLKWGRDHDYNV